MPIAELAGIQQFPEQKESALFAIVQKTFSYVQTSLHFEVVFQAKPAILHWNLHSILANDSNCNIGIRKPKTLQPACSLQKIYSRIELVWSFDK